MKNHQIYGPKTRVKGKDKVLDNIEVQQSDDVVVIVSCDLEKEPQNLSKWQVGTSKQVTHELGNRLLPLSGGDAALVEPLSSDQCSDQQPGVDGVMQVLHTPSVELSSVHPSQVEGSLTDMNFDYKLPIDMANAFAPLQNLLDKLDGGTDSTFSSHPLS